MVGTYVDMVGTYVDMVGAYIPVPPEARCHYGFFVKTAITAVTPPVVFHSFPPTRHTSLPQ